MSKRKIAFIWGYNRHEMQWFSHHQFWEASLREYPDTEIHRYTWENWQDMPKGYDLYFFMDFHPTLFQVSKSSFHPRIFYWFDCFHHSFAYPAQVIDCFDRSYFAELQVVKALNSMGVTKVRWMPPAFYQGLYRPVEVAKIYGWAFVGQPDDVVIRRGMTRKEFMTNLIKEDGIIGYVDQQIYGEKINLKYNESMVLLDRTIFNNIGTRFFEVVGSGGFLLANRTKIYNGIDELAVEGRHFVSYDDSYADCLDKLKYYIAHNEERTKIAKDGYDYFINNHTYAHRIKKIFDEMGL